MSDRLTDAERYRNRLRFSEFEGKLHIRRPGCFIYCDAGEAREVRDAITHWLDLLEDEADLRALDEARANDDGTRTPLRDFLKETDDE